MLTPYICVKFLTRIENKKRVFATKTRFYMKKKDEKDILYQ